MAGILTTERLTFRFRMLAVLAVGGAFAFAGYGGNAAIVGLLIVIYLIYAVSLHRLPLAWSRPTIVYPMIVMDAVFIGLINYYSGNASGLIMSLYPLLVPFYALYGAYGAAFFSATVMLIVFGATQWVAGGIVVNAVQLAQIPLYYLLAAISGYLAHGRTRRLEEQEALQRLVRLENEARSLSGAACTIQEASDLGIILQDMAEAAPRLTGLPECLIGVHDRKSGSLVARASTTDLSLLGVDRIDYLVEWPHADSLTDSVLTAHEPIALSTTECDGGRLPPWAAKAGVKAMLVVPLSNRGVDVGVMYYYGVPDGYEFTPDEIVHAQAFADVVALVSVNAQLYEDVQVTIGSVMSDLTPIVMPKPERRARRLTVIEVGDLLVDIPKRQARIDGKALSLTPTEFDLLAVLAESSGRAVDQETLLRRVWGEDYSGRSSVVDVGVHRLRRKIESGQNGTRRIVTVRGSGYVLVPATTRTAGGKER